MVVDLTFFKNALPEEVYRVIDITYNHNRWRRFETINLIASENVMSPLAEMAYITDMMHRYAEGKPKKRYYQGLKYVDEIELQLMEAMSELFNVKYVEPRAVSGTIANATIFKVLGGYGARALIAPVQAGAHVSHTRFGVLGALGIEHIELPYDQDGMNIDVDKALKMIEEIKPSFVVLGGSVYLFPHPVKEIAEAAHSVGAKVVYDAAHVLGLIAGKKWRNPIEHGADVITASTHKTFPGPQGGVILTNSKEIYKAAAKVVFPVFVSNHHLHRLPATLITTYEMKYFGEQYAEQVTRNARAFAEALASEGFKVLGEHKGYTRSHQVVLDVSDLGGGALVAQKLEDANIIVNKNLLPKDPPTAIKNPSGIRIGVQEMTRWGMKESDFKELAKIIKKLLIDGRDVVEIRKEVIEFRKDFTKIHYAFNIDYKAIESSEKLPLLW